MNTRGVRSILISRAGNLYISRQRGRSTKFANQLCVNYERPCSDHCPFFGDPYPSTDGLSMFVPLCEFTLECPADLFEDERTKEED